MRRSKELNPAPRSAKIMAQDNAQKYLKIHLRGIEKLLNNKKLSDQGFRLSREFTGYNEYVEDCQDLGCDHCLQVLAFAKSILFSTGGVIIEISGVYGVPDMTLGCIQGEWHFDLVKLPMYCKEDQMVYGTTDGRIIQRIDDNRPPTNYPFINVFSSLEEFEEHMKNGERLRALFG